MFSIFRTRKPATEVATITYYTSAGRFETTRAVRTGPGPWTTDLGWTVENSRVVESVAI